ncbi:hypothetical protein EV182_008864, partial [Spiromyces aspiralis]
MLDRRVRPALQMIKVWQDRSRLYRSVHYGLLAHSRLILMALARMVELEVVPPLQQ